MGEILHFVPIPRCGIGTPFRMTSRDWAQCGAEVEGAQTEALNKRVRTELGAEVEREGRCAAAITNVLLRCTIGGHKVA